MFVFFVVIFFSVAFDGLYNDILNDKSVTNYQSAVCKSPFLGVSCVFYPFSFGSIRLVKHPGRPKGKYLLGFNFFLSEFLRFVSCVFSLLCLLLLLAAMRYFNPNSSVIITHLTFSKELLNKDLFFCLHFLDF